MNLQVNPKRTAFILLVAYILCLTATYVTLVYPGKSYVTVWLPDVLGFIDIANRVTLGEVPYKDFNFAYGPFVAIIPGLALLYGGNVGAIFGISGLILSAVLLFSALLIFKCRLTTFAGLLVFLFVWLLIVMPMTNSNSYNDISWGTFYNRQGWAALIIIFVLYLEPLHIEKWDKWLDASALSILILFQLGNKIPFAIIAIGFVLINSMISRYNRQVTLRAIIIITVVIGIEEIFFGLAMPYLNNILTLSRSLAGGRLGIWVFATFIIDNAPIILGSLGAVMAARAVGHRSTFDWLFATGVIASVLLLLTTINAGSERGAFAIFIIFIVFGELARRAETRDDEHQSAQLILPTKKHIISLGCLFMASAFIASESGNRLLAWQDFTIKVQRDSLTSNTPPRLSKILIPDFDKKKGASIGIVSYMKTISDGTNLLIALNQPEKTVLSFDMVNPFPYAAQMKPPVNGYPLFYFDGTVSTNPKFLPTPNKFVGNVDYVMVPRLPYKDEQLEIMMNLYGPYLKQNYFILTQSIYWELWKRKKEAPAM